MSSYWDNIEIHRRRRRRILFGRRVMAVCGFLVFFWLLSGLAGEEDFLASLWRLHPAASTATEVPPGFEDEAPEPASTTEPPRLAKRSMADAVPPRNSQFPKSGFNHNPPEATLPASKTAPPPFENRRDGGDLQALHASLESLGPTEAIAACAEFRTKHPELAVDDAIDGLIAKLGPAPWLRLAAEEAERVSSGAGAFGAVWLPIAEAWDYCGDPAESREAMRQALASTPRMLSTNQQYTWLVDLYRDGLLQPEQTHLMLEEAVARTAELTDRYERRGMQAQLSGLASATGKQALARRLLAEATDPEREKKARERIKDYVLLKFRAWAASWHASPQSIESIAQQLERLNYRRMPLIGNAYAYAAMAAARNRDDTQFFRMALRAEAAFSQTNIRSDQSYPHVFRLAEAYLRMGKWRHALVAGNNLTDPSLAASINFRVLANAPQEVRVEDLQRLINARGNDRYAPHGVAAYVEHQLRTGEDPVAVAQWITGCEQPALRASGYAGFARASDSLSVPAAATKDPEFPASLESPRSLIEEARRRAETLGDPIAAAASLTQTARAWSLTNRRRSYEEAAGAATTQCLDAWAELWRRRPPASRSYRGTYSASDTGRRRRELDGVTRLLRTQLMLAQMQADLGDSHGALDTCLHLAATAGYAYGLEQDLTEWHYAAIAALLDRTQHETGVGAEAIASRWRHRRPFSRAMTAAWLGDAATAKSLLEAIAKDSHDKGHVARVHAELAAFYARRGDIDAYRSARRTAYRASQQRRAAPYVNNALAIADALAGEYVLAQDTLTRGVPKWSNGASHTYAEIARGQARRGDWEASLEAAKRIGADYPGYRCQAFTAVGHARYREAASRTELLRWAEELDRPIDQIGALCGLALAAEGVGAP